MQNDKLKVKDLVAECKNRPSMQECKECPYKQKCDFLKSLLSERCPSQYEDLMEWVV